MLIKCKILLLCCLVFLRFSSVAQTGSKQTIRDNQSVFEPITTNAYTDSLFFQNLKKSEKERDRLNNPPTVEEIKTIDVRQRIKSYEMARDKYLVNSQEYRDVQSKIDRLKFEFDIKE